MQQYYEKKVSPGSRAEQLPLQTILPRIGLLKASDGHLPGRRVSEKPDAAAWEAAAILKLWPLYLVQSSPQYVITLANHSVWVTGTPFRC